MEMKKIIVAGILGIAFLTSCGSDAAKTQRDSSVIADSGKSGKSNIAVKYQCPMKCEGEKTYTAPGKCPQCQMDLAEVK